MAMDQGRQRRGLPAQARDPPSRHGPDAALEQTLKHGRRAAAACGTLLTGGFRQVGMSTFGQLLISGVLIGSIYALMSMGLTLVFGVLRIVNFAHGEFLMIAMYGAWAITHLLGLNPYFAAVAIVPAMILFGGVVYMLIVKPGLDKPHLVVVFATMGL